MIEEQKLEEILNSKSEYGHNVIPRMRIEVGARVMRDEELVEFRRQVAREAEEMDAEWEKEEARGLAGKRDGERMEQERSKRRRIGDQGGIVGEERVIVGEVKMEGGGGGPKRRFFSNSGTPTIGARAPPTGITNKLGHELPQATTQNSKIDD